jgi:hypothetical protein
MAVTIEPDTTATDTINLPDAIAEIKTKIDPDDPDTLYEIVPALQALARNRSFLGECLLEDLVHPDKLMGEMATDSSVVFFRTPRLEIRANLWFPPHHLPPTWQKEAERFNYLIPHTHRFDFVTIGYLGPGYRTAIYHWDGASEDAEPGHEVKLQLMEETKLPEGKVMRYTAFKDVHYQFHPEDFSVSLNVMIFPRDAYCRQPLFDIDKKLVRALLFDSATTQIMACRIAAATMAPSLLNHLEYIGRTHENPRVRKAVREVLPMGAH